MHDIEFIRSLINLIDSRKAPPVIVNVTVNTDGSTSSSINPDDTETALDRDDVFVPPLQAKIEMMKKMSGVEPKNQELLSSEDDEPFDG